MLLHWAGLHMCLDTQGPGAQHCKEKEFQIPMFSKAGLVTHWLKEAGSIVTHYDGALDK